MKAVFFRACSLVLALVFMMNVPQLVRASDRGDAKEVFSQVSANSHCLMDADTGVVLSSKKPDVPLPMASTTKIMTCLVALEKADINTPVTVPKEAVGTEGSSVYLTAGEKMTLLDLLYAVMLESANDAAVAVAFAVSGGIEAFSELMNEKAKEIGMTNTHFVNPHGLPAEEHYSTSRDLAVLMCVALQNRQFAEISGTETKSIPASNGKSRFLSNHNKLLRSYEDCIAGKTGFTKKAGRCLVTAAKRCGKTLVCTTLGAPDDWQDHKALFEFGFSQYSNQVLAGIGEISVSIPVVGGTVDSVTVENLDCLTLFLRSDERVTSFIELPPFVYAPVNEGDVLGEAVFCVDDQEAARLPLICKSDALQREIKLSFWQTLWNRILSWFS